MVNSYFAEIKHTSSRPLAMLPALGSDNNPYLGAWAVPGHPANSHTLRCDGEFDEYEDESSDDDEGDDDAYIEGVFTEDLPVRHNDFDFEDETDVSANNASDNDSDFTPPSGLDGTFGDDTDPDDDLDF